MSDASQGEGWWQASDGKWYPPQAAAPPPPPSYPPPGAYMPSQQQEGSAVTAMVLGILSFVICPIVLAIPAIVLGTRSRRLIDASGGALGGRGMATAGFTLGIVNLCLLVPLIGIAALSFVGTSTSTKFSNVGSNLSVVLPWLRAVIGL
jgi:hypothetical protein